MDAIRYLTRQHRELDLLLEAFERAPLGAARKLDLCRKIRELLAAHALIEERILFPETRRLLTPQQLDDLGEAMEGTVDELLDDPPRPRIACEADGAATV